MKGSSLNLFQHDYRSVPRVEWKNLGGLQSFDFNHIDHFWDELECQSHSKPSSSSVPDGTNTFVAEWAQTPTGTLQNVVENYFCSNRLRSNLVLECDVQHVEK